MKKLVFPITQKEAEKSGAEYSSQTNKKALFPSRLRELREKKGVSQAVLSAALGVSKSTVGLWETGDTLPDAKALYNMAGYFGVSSDYLLCRTDNMTVNEDIQSACKLTGLSESTVDFLKSLKDDNSLSSRDVLTAINLLLSDEYFDFWSRIFAYIDASYKSFNIILTTRQETFPADDVLQVLLNANNQDLKRLRNEWKSKQEVGSSGNKNKNRPQR